MSMTIFADCDDFMVFVNVVFADCDDFMVFVNVVYLIAMELAVSE